jgi:RNA polymerase sigma-70 factor (ECF subfamily)
MTSESVGQPSEGSLVEAARRGDRAALSRLLEQHQQRVFGFGVKMCGDVEDAKEVAQETLLTLVRNLPGFRGEASISTWLYTVARSFCIKKRRRTKGAPAHHEPLDTVTRETASEAAAAVFTPEQMLQSREARDAVATALDMLDPDWREVIVLRDIEGLSAAEVADVTGLGVAAVKSRLHRARAALRTNLVALLGETSTPAPASCPDVLTMLSKKLEDEMSPEVCAQMEDHLQGCPHCKGLCDSLKKTLAACRALPTPSVPVQVQESLRRAIAEAMADNHGQ